MSSSNSQPDAGTIASDFIQAYNAKLSAVAPTAVGSQVLLMSVISLVTVLAFNILRPQNKIIYEPKSKYFEGDKRPPKIPNGFFDWVKPLLTTNEDTLMHLIGLDAVAYLRFLRMLRYLFVIVAALVCAVLIPVNVVFTKGHTANYNTLSMLTIGSVSGNILYVHAGITYLITFIILGFVYINWRRMVELKIRFFRSPEYIESFYARTLMIRHVPQELQSDLGIQALFQSLQAPYPTTDVYIGRQVGSLPELIEYHNETVRKLEHVLVSHLKGGQVGKKRPTIRLGATMGCGGEQVDAIDHYTEKIKKLEATIEDQRAKIDLRKAEDYGFASMAAVSYAHVVARMVYNKTPQGAKITMAPNPKDIIWKNLKLDRGTRARLRVWGFMILAVVCFFNTIPLLAISALANLAALTQIPGLEFLDKWQSASNITFSIVSGVLPPAVSGIFSYFLPIIMRRLAKYSGTITRSSTDAQVVARYYAFLVISQFLIFSLIGVGFDAVSKIINDVNQSESAAAVLNDLSNALPGEIQSTYVSQSNYWLTWYPLRGFLVVFDLAQLINLIYIFIRTHLFGRTPRDIRDWTKPPSFDYAIYSSAILFMATVALLYAPLAPLVPVMATVVFWISSFIYKYQLMFVFTTKIESGGRMWNVVINRLLMATVFMQLLMALTMWLGAGRLAAISMVPPILIVLAFKMYTARVFNGRFMFHTPDGDELAVGKVYSQKADVKRARLGKRFGHPALHAELFTPMVHANMAKLLPEVYHGRLTYGTAKVAEYGNQKLGAQIAGGITIASVEQNDLEYDPQLYQRDRGEQDWDTRSIASTVAFGSSQEVKSTFVPLVEGVHDHEKPKLAAIDSYLQYGPGHQAGASTTSLTSSLDDSELNRAAYHGDDNRPLLNRQISGDTLVNRAESPMTYPPMYPSPLAGPQGIVPPYDINRSRTPTTEPLLPRSRIPTADNLAYSPRPGPPSRQPTAEWTASPVNVRPVPPSRQAPANWEAMSGASPARSTPPPALNDNWEFPNRGMTPPLRQATSNWDPSSVSRPRGPNPPSRQRTANWNPDGVNISGRGAYNRNDALGQEPRVDVSHRSFM
ncbi:DUF221-domain-containing protein [Dacryopinax primogenitus]|uniref:DUF221-domain-containing protein n=1 Tax=Dacryopinax primogenitus (strain DJM 731) TaxID=1858805 RepID=M5FU47_DACPD|nr:DUF221-domain-containing protein [Dacryopinax primogenitus]EJT96751.1 DUF221-domain-containing protein [Dacryopinax primogenitus]